jgi:hypothetical protein
MKAWILAAVVAAVLVLVGVPAVALTLGSHGAGDSASAAPTPTPTPQGHHAKGPDGHHWMGKPHQGWGPPGMRPGNGHGPFQMHRFPMHKLTAKQRDALADRLDEHATQLHKAATCLRQKSDVAACLKSSFGRGGLSPRPPRG